MKKIIVMTLLSILTGGCNSQKKQTENPDKQISFADSAKPQTRIRVNKQYDEHGNLVQFDSTYSYFYSSKGAKESISGDSLFSDFKAPLRLDYQGLLNANMDSIFFNDSLFKYDFFNSDYFSKRFQMNISSFENMFRQMDSIKSEMLSKSYPEGQIRKR